MIYNMKKRVFAILLCMIMLFSLTSCGTTSEELFPQIKADFEQFSPKGDVILYSSFGKVFTEDHTYRLPEVNDESYETSYILALEVINNKIYYLVNKYNNPAKTGYDVVLYECDLNGENYSSLWKKTFYAKKQPEALFIQNNIYVMSIEDDVTTVEEIHVLTATATTYFQGEVFDFSIIRNMRNEQKQYTCQTEKDGFIITNLKTNNTYTVNNDTLEKFGYLDLVQQYNGHEMASWVIYDRVYVVYRLWVEDYFEIPQGYPWAIFEYDEESDKLIFQTVLYPGDIEGYELEDVTVLQD